MTMEAVRALPRIAPYDLAAAAAKPAGGVGWHLDRERAVLLVHDMQEYFAASFDRTQPPFAGTVANIARLRAAAHRAGVPVVYSAQPGDQPPAERALLADFWGPGMRSDPAEQSIIEALAPASGDTVITKWRYSAFQRTPLRQVLDDAGRDQLVVTGIYAHIGCLATCLEAFMTDVQPFLVADAVADFSLADHRMAVDYASRRCAAIVDTDAVAATFDDAAPVDREWLRAAVATRVGEAVGDDDDLVDVGLDSVHVMEIVEELQAAGHDVGFAQLAERYTLSEWFALLGV